MDMDEIQMDVEEQFEKSLGSLENEFRRIRTGRASAAMLDHVQVEAYGSMMPLKQMASINTPEPQQLLVKPYDKGTIHAVEKALSEVDLGAAPASDGEVIRINLPPLSGDRRKQLAAQAKDAGEKCRVAMRNARRDGIKAVESTGKEEKWPEDDVKKGAEDITALLKEAEGKVDALVKEKMDDILEM